MGCINQLMWGGPNKYYEEKQNENQNTKSTQRDKHAYTSTRTAQWRGSYVEGSCMLCLVTSDGGI